MSVALTLLPWVAVLAVAVVGWLQGRRADRADAARAAATVERERADFERAIQTTTAEQAKHRAEVLAEELHRAPPNADLDPLDVDGRLLRAARAAGADGAVRADLGELSDPAADPRS